MTQWTEEMIREVLDGTYTRLDSEGRVVVDVGDAPRDHVARGGRKKGTKVRQSYWTPQEDDILYQMKLRNKPYSEIAWIVNHSEDAVKKRWQKLRVEKGVVG